MGNLLTPANALTAVFIALAYSVWGFLGKYLGVGGGWLSSTIFMSQTFL